MKLAAVLLAGGESRRMGADKACLIVGGKPLWQIQLDLLRSLRPDEIFISARTDPSWRPEEVRFVADNPPSHGPLSGLAAAMAYVDPGGHLAVLAVDMPFMNAGFLRALCHNIAPGRGVLPFVKNRAEPLAAIYPAEIHSDLIAALSGTDFSLQTLTKRLVRTERLRIIRIRPEEEKLFRNINNWADLRDSVPSR
jgi:molybdopterin-guanine dinucleotide biosynthesis protein A